MHRPIVAANAVLLVREEATEDTTPELARQGRLEKHVLRLVRDGDGGGSQEPEATHDDGREDLVKKFRKSARHESCAREFEWRLYAHPRRRSARQMSDCP